MKNQFVETIRFLNVCLAASALLACTLSMTENLSAQDPPKYTQDSIDSSLVIPDRDSVSKQEYDTKKRDVQSRLTSLDSNSKKILKGELNFGPNRDTIDKFFGGFLLPRMTQYDDVSISIGKERDRLLRDYLPRATNTTARDYLLDSVLLPFAKKVCEGNYHPAARVNAMYIIADINRREGVRRSSAPQLMTPSLTYMIQTIDDATKPAFLKVPALQGIERHIGIDQNPARKQVNDPTRGGIRDRMLKLVQQPYTGKPAEDDLMYFQQRIATRILGNLQDPGTANNVASQLKSMIASEKLRLWLRHDAIAAFGKLQFPDDAASKTLIIDTINQAVKMVSTLARQQAVSIEKDILTMKENVLVFTGQDLAKIGIKKDEEEALREMSMGTGGDFETESGTSSSDDKKPKVELPNYRLNLLRRELQTVTSTTAIALLGKERDVVGGLAAQLTAKDADAIKAIVTKLRKMMRDIDVAVLGEDFENKNRKEVIPDKALTDQLREELISSANEIDQVASSTKPKTSGKKGGGKAGKTATKISPLDGGKKKK